MDAHGKLGPLSRAALEKLESCILARAEGTV